MGLRWGPLPPSLRGKDIAESLYADTDAGRFMAVRHKYKRHWNAKHGKREGTKSFAVETKEEAIHLCEQWAADAAKSGG
jgi:hypothetical protein